MAFHALGDLLPSHLKRVGIWQGVQTQSILEKCQQIVGEMFPATVRFIQCAAVRDGVLVIKAHSSALSSDIHMQEGVLLQKFREARILDIHKIHIIV